VKIACIGGGPAGLYLGILVKRSAPEHEVIVYERNKPAETFGFGVVFSDATLGHLAAADPESHAAITARFARWGDIAIHFGGEVMRSTGHGFCGLSRKRLLQLLQQRAQQLGVKVEFDREIRSLSEVTADVTVACDGASSWVRDSLAAQLRPEVDVRPNKFVWLGCTVPYDAFTFLFKTTPHGLYRVHAYPYAKGNSTFIVECREDTWRATGFDDADEDRTVEILSRLFATELAGHRLVKNRSIWRNFPTVRCRRWSAGNVVLLGDACHTAHFSIGSGTKMAMEDAIVLRDQLLGASDIPAALLAYEKKRRPDVEALQAAAQASLEWFEGTERYEHLKPVQFAYSLLTRSQRVSHASVTKRDPHLARGVERLLAAEANVLLDPPPPPTTLPIQLGDRKARSRIAVAPEIGLGVGDANELAEDQLVGLGGMAAAGAGMVVTPGMVIATRTTGPGLGTDEQTVGWGRTVDYVHRKGALIIARLELPHVSHAALEAACQRAAFANFDLLLLDPCSDPAATERLPTSLHVARVNWRAGGWLAAVVRDRPAMREAVVAYAAQLARAGADLLWVTSFGETAKHPARIPAAPFADRLRNELRVPTAVDGAEAQAQDLDAAIAAGRADLVVCAKMPTRRA
jgi:anthraniloyl-CoA monooxygenase